MCAQTKSLIEDLLDKPFSARSYSEKCLIVENGRPCPKLSSLKSVHKDSKKEYTRNFKESQYAIYPWLAGCENKVKLFCWPCLLFSRVHSAWSSTGVENLNTLQTLQKKHKLSVAHLQSVLKLASFGENKVDTALSAHLRMLNTQHNLQVKKNREVLKRLIDVTCFLANQELPFRGQKGEIDESISSLNRGNGNYLELLKLLKRYDSTLAENFQTAAVFKETSMTIQNDLIKAVGKLLNSHICKRLEISEFVTIMLDESSESQLSVVLRYCLEGKIHETFVEFIDVSSNKSADYLFEHIKRILQNYGIVEKLVAQTYDGAAVMKGDVKDLQNKVTELCPKALFVHCSAHVLNFLLSQGLNNIRECKIFFSTLNGIATFKSYSSERTYALKEYLKQKMPSLDTTRWWFSSRLVNVVHRYGDNVVEYFEIIQTEDNIWDSKDRMAASGYTKFLENYETVFLLNVFSKLFAESDELFNTLQNENIDITFCVNQINKFVDFLKAQRVDGFLEVWQHTSQTVADHAQRSKIQDQFDSNDDEIKRYKEIFNEIIDNLLMQISERFSSFEILKYFSLLNGKKYNEYTQKNKFPEELMESLIKLYPDIFEYSQLKSELTVFYANSEDIRHYVAAELMGIEAATTNTKHVTPYDVLLYIENKNIAGSFEQVYKLSKLICTIPTTSLSVEGTHTALKRIKRYLNSTRGQERLSFLDLLSIEKAMLAELQDSDNFYDLVIENFLSDERRVDFMYK